MGDGGGEIAGGFLEQRQVGLELFNNELVVKI